MSPPWSSHLILITKGNWRVTKIKPRSWLCLRAALPSARSSLHLPKSKLKSLNKAKINATYLLTSLLFPHLVGMKTRMLLGWEAPIQHPLKPSLCPGPSSGCGGGGCCPKILMPGTAPTKRHKTETSTRRCSRLRSPMLSRHCTYCSVTILPTPQHPPYTWVLFSRNTFGSKMYAHLLHRKPNIQLFQAERFYFSLGAPMFPFGHDAGAHFRSELTHRFPFAVPAVTAQNSPSTQGPAAFWMRRKSRDAFR